MAILVMTVGMTLNASTVNAAAKKQPKLNYKTVYLCRYHSCSLKVKNTKKDIQWTTSDSGVAAVEKDGTLTGNNPGQCKVTAKFGKKKLTCQVTVTEYDKGEIFAAYGWEAARQLLGPQNGINVKNVAKGTFLNNIDFGYLEATCTDRYGEEKTVYVYVYQQDLPEEGQAYMDTPGYGNLIIRVDTAGMDRMVKDRSTELDYTRVQTAYSSIHAYEELKAEASSSFIEKHFWIGT